MPVTANTHSWSLEGLESAGNYGTHFTFHIILLKLRCLIKHFLMNTSKQHLLYDDMLFIYFLIKADFLVAEQKTQEKHQVLYHISVTLLCGNNNSKMIMNKNVRKY